MVNPFRVPPEGIGALGPYDAVERVANLVRADAAVSGMSGTEIDIPGNITAADGGVDGIARDAPRQSLYGLVKEGTTAYQIRSGRFAPGRGIKEMLFTRTGAIKERIRSCIEQGGTLVILLTGWDGADRTDGEMVGRFQQALASRSEAYAHAKIDVWGRSRIAAAMEKFPVLALDMGYKTGVRIHNHVEWSSFIDMSYPFMNGSGEDEFMSNLREKLIEGDTSGPVYVHVSGEPGSGKTRLVLESTRTASLAPRIVYAKDPPAAEPFLREIMAGTGGGRWATGAAPILIVDECDPDARASLCNVLMNNKDGVHLVTIYNEPDEFAKDDEKLSVGNMADEQIEGILWYHAGRKDIEIGKWVEYARPSPRAAHIVGGNLSSNPLNMFAPPRNVRVWERWIAGGGRRYDDKEYEDRYIVLLWLSLFTKFGFDAPHESDAAAIAEMIHMRHPDLPEWRFREIVEALRDSKVLQGHSILYITPRLLHDYLWLKWWKRYGDKDAPSAADLAAGGGEGGGGGMSMTARSRRYCDMFARMRDRPEARAIVERLLGPSGLFDRREDLRRSLGSGFFAMLAVASPAAALACLERAFGRMTTREIGRLDSRMREAAVVVVGRMMARHETFSGAALLLLRLAAADGGKGAKGAAASSRGPAAAFCRAFDPAPRAGYGDVPLRERLDMLAEAAGAAGGGRMDAGDGGECARLAAIRACGEVLRMERNSLAVPYRCDFGRPAEAWHPDAKDRAAAVGYLGEVVALLGRVAGDRTRSESERRAAAQSLVGSLTQTALVREIAGRVLDEAESLRDAGLADGEEMLAIAAHMAANESERLGEEALSRLRRMVDGASASADLHTRLARRMERRRHPDTDRDCAELARLAEEAAGSPDALAAELDWLASGSVAEVDRFGFELARHDRALSLSEPILAATKRAASARDGGARLLGGYLARLSRDSPDEAGRILGRMCDDDVLRRLLPDVGNVTGALSDRAAAAIEAAATEDKIDAPSLELLGSGSPLNGVSQERFGALVRAVIGMAERLGGAGNKEDADTLASTALNMLHEYYLRDEAGNPSQARPMSERLALHVLLHPCTTGCRAGEVRGMINHNKWSEAALAAARGGREAALAIAGGIMSGLDGGGLFHRRGPLSGTFQAALDEIARMHPREVWEMAASRIGPPVPDGRAPYEVMKWLRGEYEMPRNWLSAHTSYVKVGGIGRRGGMSAIPLPVILEWAGRDEGARAAHVAPLLPPRFEAVRGFLARFGHIKGVREGVSASLGRRPVEHPSAGHYSRMRAELEEWRRGETNPNVIAWLDEYESAVEERIGRELEYEVGWLHGREAAVAAEAAAAR